MSFVPPLSGRRIGAAAILTLLVLGLAPAAPAAAETRLKVQQRDNVLVVRGSHFPARSNGRVVFIRGDNRRVKHVRSGGKGRIRTTFRVRPRYEGSVRVSAVVGRQHAPTTFSVQATLTQREARRPKRTKEHTTADPTTSEPTTSDPTSPTATPTAPTELRSAAYGVDPTWQPQGDVTVPVGTLTQRFVDSYPQGTKFVLAPGVHRLPTRIRPRSGQQFLGQPGAVVNGSQVLTDFVQSGTTWIAGGQTQRFEPHGECMPGKESCRYAEDVFLDGAPLEQVMDQAKLGAGRFWFDYTTSRIVLADDPTGRLVETTVADAAFVAVSGADNVRVANLVVEKFGSKAQHGAVDGRDARGWVVERNVVRLNHGAGVITGDGSRVLRNAVVSNGELGMGGQGLDVLVEGNEIARNNWAGFDYGWEGGGTKWALTDGLVVRGNWSHHNTGPGLWTDEGNIRTTFDRNLVEDNLTAGIFHEISYDALITGNTVLRNGFGHAEWGYGAGIQISASPNVTVTNNHVEGNARGITLIMQQRGVGPHGLREVANVAVHNNVVVMDTGFTGLVQDVGDRSYFTSRNNRFSDNEYLLGGQAQPFAWMDGLRPASEWRGYGNDVTGVFNTR